MCSAFLVNDFCVHREAEFDTGSPGHTHPATSQGRRRGSTPRQRPHASDHGFREKREPARGSETHGDCFTDWHHRDRKLRGQQPGANAIPGTAMPRPQLPLLGPLAPRAPGHLTWRGRGAVTWPGPPSAPRMRRSSPPAARPGQGWGHPAALQKLTASSLHVRVQLLKLFHMQ